MRSYSAVVAEELFSFFVYLVSRLFYKGILMCCSDFSFFRFFFFPVRFRALLYFFLFQAVDCLLNRTRVSDVVEQGTGAPTVEDTGAHTNLGPASERKPKAPLSPPPGASKASQSNDVDIIDDEETPGILPDNCSSYFLPGGSVIYPVLRRVLLLLAGWQCHLPS